MKPAGRTTIGGSSYLLAADRKIVGRYNMPRSGQISKGCVALDGLGAGALGPQVCSLVIYDTANNLIATSDEVSVALGQPLSWVDFRFSAFGGAIALPAGDFFAGLHGGPYSNTIQIHGSDPFGMGGKSNADTYSDGASPVFGAATPLTESISCYLKYFSPYSSLVPVETDLYYSRLPYKNAQAILGVGGPESVARVTNAGWHDTFIDPEIGSVALVRDGSALADLLGERIRVTTQGVGVPRSAVAYVHSLADANAFDWDLSLSRHVYSQLALLASDPIPVAVEVIA